MRSRCCPAGPLPAAGYDPAVPSRSGRRNAAIVLDFTRPRPARYLVLPLALALACPDILHAQTIIDFEQVDLAPGATVTATAEHPDTAFVIDGVALPSRFDTSFGGFWTGGWALTRSTDLTGNFTNLFGAAPGGDFQTGIDGAPGVYAVGQNRAALLLPPGAQLLGLSYTNTAYTAAVLRDGSQFSRAFGIGPDGASNYPDSLMLSVSGYLDGAATFVQNLPLADFRDPNPANDYILDRWVGVFLAGTPFQGYAADSVSFQLLSSDAGAFGNNTPDFFALATITIMIDPSSLGDIARARPLTVFPNPARGSVQVRAGKVQRADLYLADASGRIVRQAAGVSLAEAFALGGIAPGVYTLLAVSDGETFASRVVVQ